MLQPIPDIFPFFSTSTIFSSIFSTRKRVNRNKPGLVTKWRKSQKQQILLQSSVKCDCMPYVVHKISPHYRVCWHFPCWEFFPHENLSCAHQSLVRPVTTSAPFPKEGIEKVLRSEGSPVLNYHISKRIEFGFKRLARKSNFAFKVFGWMRTFYLAETFCVTMKRTKYAAAWKLWINI